MDNANGNSRRGFFNRYQWILLALGLLVIVLAVVFRVLDREKGIGTGGKGGGMGGSHESGLVEEAGEKDGTADETTPETTGEDGTPTTSAEPETEQEVRAAPTEEAKGKDDRKGGDGEAEGEGDVDGGRKDDGDRPIPVDGMRKGPVTRPRPPVAPKGPVAQPKDDDDTSRQSVRLKGSEAKKKKGFFGSGSVSGNVVFLVDISGSMGATTPEGMSRIDLLRGELKKVLTEKLDGLKKGKTSTGKFLIIPFDDSCQVFPSGKRLSFGSQTDLKTAIKFVDEMRPRGGTNMTGAWALTRKMLAQYKFDTVYFLSDGEDPAFDPKTIRKLDIRVMTFSLGVKSDLMEKIAKQHRGRYSEIY